MTGFMPPADTSPDSADRREAGRLAALVMRWFFRQASIAKVDALSEGFRLITLAGPGLRDVAWKPGQKIQIDVGAGANRTYTPLSWDAIAGEARILAFAHGDGPGAAWALNARAGDACQFFGPRRSLDLEGVDDDLPVLFGDETSFGLAQALSARLGASGAAVFLFEVSSVEASTQAWRSFGTQRAIFIQRAEADAHLEEVEARMLQILDEWAPTPFVLSGKATSIQRLRRVLGSRGVASSQLRTKVYWAPGKTGLD
ncbi:siderophore-interacting protein [Plastoroseomonas hellenica]|uniref:siderophore-interacting protein n=1 Tax=Plastoroseomonas hellenica TaxID=2687306 RepID=UPI001BA85588|nr:siderophore-interacting protein [Plastoroseomonas hellenica]